MSTPELAGYLLGKTLGLLSNCLSSTELERHGERLAIEANQHCQQLGLGFSFTFPADVAHRSAYRHETFGHTDASFYQAVEALEQKYGKRARAAFEVGFIVPQRQEQEGFAKLWQASLRRNCKYLKIPEATVEMFLFAEGAEAYREALGRLEGFLRKPRTVFLSYRREAGMPFARMLYIHLTYSGYDVFLDVETLGAVQFGPEILEVIGRSYFFMPILSAGTLEGCDRNEDWVRKEISHGLEVCKKVIPIVCEGFVWPEELSLHESIRGLRQHNGCYLSHTNFGGFAEKLGTMLE
jgi:hypothetical protein